MAVTTGKGYPEGRGRRGLRVEEVALPPVEEEEDAEG